MNTATTASATATTTVEGVALREGFADVGTVTLHYVEAGEGPLVVLLHGFPSFWYSWNEQIAPLVNAGYHVVAPDLRGYNLSSKPGDFTDYTADKPAADIRGLIRALGSESATVVGHDWGGSVAWTLAMNSPEVVDRLVILNAAHPRKLNEGLKNPRQLLRSWYFFYFQLKGSPERRAARDDWQFFKGFLRDAHPAYTKEELARYTAAWSQRGAAKGMIDYYRAAVRLGSKQKVQTISAPTLVIWGQEDRYLGADLAEPHKEDVPNLVGVERLPNASHWVHHDEAGQVNQLLIDFLAGR
jgi:pimeloyl-ACP methyl ester carboxylesterase